MQGVVLRRPVLEAFLNGTEQADGKEKDGADEREDAFDGDAEEAEGEEQEPGDGVEHEGKQSDGPGEDEEEGEEEEFEHEVGRVWVRMERLRSSVRTSGA